MKLQPQKSSLLTQKFLNQKKGSKLLVFLAKKAKCWLWLFNLDQPKKTILFIPRFYLTLQGSTFSHSLIQLALGVP